MNTLQQLIRLVYIHIQHTVQCTVNQYMYEYSTCMHTCIIFYIHNGLNLKKNGMSTGLAGTETHNFHKQVQVYCTVGFSHIK